MPNAKFRIGAVYCATPAMQGAKQRLVIPVGRVGGQMQVATVDDLVLTHVAVGGLCDREFAQMVLADGSYSFSSACEVSAAEYARVRKILGGEA